MYARNQSIIVRDEVIETNFGFYTDDDIKRLSVCKLTSPIAFDALGNTLQGLDCGYYCF